MFRSDIYRIYSMYEISLIENIFRQNNIDPIWYTSTLGVQILSISCSFWENLAKSYVGAPPGSWRPLLGEILDPPLNVKHMYPQSALPNQHSGHKLNAEYISEDSINQFFCKRNINVTESPPPPPEMATAANISILLECILVFFFQRKFQNMSSGTRTPLCVQFFFIFMQFSAKIMPNQILG